MHGKGLGLARRTRGQEQELRLPAAPRPSTGDLVLASLSSCLGVSLPVLCTFSALVHTRLPQPGFRWSLFSCIWQRLVGIRETQFQIPRTENAIGPANVRCPLVQDLGAEIIS